jgi:hypothetical protein
MISAILLGNLGSASLRQRHCVPELTVRHGYRFREQPRCSNALFSRDICMDRMTAGWRRIDREGAAS